MPSLAPDGAVFAGGAGAFSTGAGLGGAWVAGACGAGVGAVVVCGASVAAGMVATGAGAGAGAGALTVKVVLAVSVLPSIITCRRWSPGASSWKVTCVEPEREKRPSST
jgi:hypothetical protein